MKCKEILSVSYFKGDSDILYSIDTETIDDLKSIFKLFHFEYDDNLSESDNLVYLADYAFKKDGSIVMFYKNPATKKYLN